MGTCSPSRAALRLVDDARAERAIMPDLLAQELW
jgi:hypothetical protein